MAQETKPAVGIKISPEEAAKLDPAKRGLSQVMAPEGAEVEGQYRYKRYVVCPWCGLASWIWYDTQRYLWYTCCHCGQSFRA